MENLNCIEEFETSGGFLISPLGSKILYWTGAILHGAVELLNSGVTEDTIYYA
ncbi:MAG: hypothetical protein IPP04_15700 [Saprospiraceae bacterium]|nr:hypothetical protein [Saprospiraceae bacterium]MBK9931300.1 hypothetical protein [Saprospiraceae bacterium]MBL0109668.1 hypothetical protein [Saprospiraceae bacterium]